MIEHNRAQAFPMLLIDVRLFLTLAHKRSCSHLRYPFSFPVTQADQTACGAHQLSAAGRMIETHVLNSMQ
jgi:hypothetical protein